MEKVLSYVDLGIKEGAQLVTGGKRFGDKGFFVHPTVFANVKEGMQIAQEEVHITISFFQFFFSIFIYFLFILDFWACNVDNKI